MHKLLRYAKNVLHYAAIITLYVVITLCGVTPVNDWTMTTGGSKQVVITGLGDKRDTFFSNKCPF